MMNAPLKAIETVFKGYRMRSRLEARWAVFFESLGVKWEYENEGFETSAGWYLPDFYLPRERCWIEIKPAMPEGYEFAKIHALSQSLNALRRAAEDKFNSDNDAKVHPALLTDTIWILIGQPWHDSHQVSEFADQPHVRSRLILCPLCERITTHFPDSDDELVTQFYCEWCDMWDRNTGENAHVKFHKGMIDSKDGSCLWHSRRMNSAFAAARSARFEHGATGL